MAKKKSQLNIAYIIAGAAAYYYFFLKKQSEPIKGIAAASDKVYVGTYKVVKIYRDSQRREVLERGLTREEAMRVVDRYPDSDRSMVVFMKQYTADKYYQ